MDKTRNMLLILGLLLQINILIAAPAKSSAIDKTKEQVNFDEQPFDRTGGDEDEEVSELEDLKYESRHEAELDANENILEKLDKLLTLTNGKDVEKSENVEESLKQLHENNPHHHVDQHTDGKEESPATSTEKETKPVKTYRGAARLTYGQNADEHTSTTTTTTTEAITTTKAEEELNEESAPVTEIITNNGQRRSTKSDYAEILLKHNTGKLSAMDMSQYIFWTGDEIGVAKAVEEMIQEGLMSRENAIKFLRDIRLGIQYLEKTYSFGDKEGETNAPTALPPTPESTTEHHKYMQIKTHPKYALNDNSISEEPQATFSPAVLKAIQKLPGILRLSQASNQRDSNHVDQDEVAGRLHLADFLYSEYSLEEVIYQLAKTMFTQSLTQGSEQAQIALQKLTGFLEAEGNKGRISPALQKKILDVLLAALSDILAENPALMNKVRNVVGDIPVNGKSRYN